jgi:hypothetical protein
MSYCVVYGFLSPSSTTLIDKLKGCNEEANWRRCGSACFGSWEYKYAPKKDMFLSMKLPYWTDKVVNEWNSKFKNIKIAIRFERTYIGTPEYDSFGDFTGNSGEDIIDSKPTKDVLESLSKNKFKCSYYPILEIHTAKEYNIGADSSIKNLVGVFFRVLSYDECYIKSSGNPFKDEEPDSDYLERIVSINNLTKDYGNGHCLCEHNIDIRTILLMDQINFMNYVDEVIGFVKRQTSILCAIENGVIKVKQKFNINVLNDHEIPYSEDYCKGRIVEDNPDEDDDVEEEDEVDDFDEDEETEEEEDAW